MSNDNEQAKADQPLGWNVPNINDLRSAIEHIKNFKGQYIETDHPVDPKAELAGVY
jgi:4-hydroxy-3-polyprenylbenzoate decarboxylase